MAPNTFGGAFIFRCCGEPLPAENELFFFFFFSLTLQVHYF